MWGMCRHIATGSMTTTFTTREGNPEGLAKWELSYEMEAGKAQEKQRWGPQMESTAETPPGELESKGPTGKAA